MTAVENNIVIPAPSEAAAVGFPGPRRTFRIPSIHPVQPCVVCENLELEHGYIWILISQLKRTVAAACPTCSLIYQVLQSLRNVQFSDSSLSVLRNYDEDPVNCDRVLRWYDDRKPTVSITIESITLFRSQRSSVSILLQPYAFPHPWLLHVFAEPGETYHWQAVKQDSSVYRNLDLAAKWIEGQMMTAAKAQLSPLPTRILEINGSYCVRLKQCTSDEYAHYACLSYCWGKNPQKQLRTTKITLTKYQSEVEWFLLPQTFRDALTLTRKLGLKYFWIDSLCIVQDDPEDWRTEGSNMANIYTNSFITISAMNAASSNDGLYISTPKDDLYVVQTPDEQFKLRVNDGINSTPYDGSMPLSKRAWFFQERVLAPRIVHFAKDELFWEDTQGISCECSGPNIVQYSNYDCSSIKPQHLAGADIQGRSRWWHRAVEAYSKLQLTFESDIFPALQGIAHVMQQNKNCEYYAGLWQDDFIKDMLWYCPLSGTRPRAFRAPTWSWASLVGPVIYDENFVNDICASVRSVTVTSVGSDPLGQLRTASATIRGPAFTASTLRLENDDQKGSNPYMLSLNQGDELMNVMFGKWFPDVENGQNNGEVLVMRMVDTSESFRPSIFLIFRRIGDESKMYERVGYWRPSDRINMVLTFVELEITII